MPYTSFDVFAWEKKPEQCSDHMDYLKVMTVGSSTSFYYRIAGGDRLTKVTELYYRTAIEGRSSGYASKTRQCFEVCCKKMTSLRLIGRYFYYNGNKYDKTFTINLN
jgi:hypothetical protein